MNKLLLSSMLFFVLLLAPFTIAYGVTFYSPEQNPQYGKIYEKVEPNTLYDFEVKKDIIAITGIAFRIDKEAQSAGITVYTLASAPDLPNIPESGVFEFNELKYAGFVPHDTIDVQYRFKVAKDWLQNSSVNRNSIAMHVFNRKTDNWDVLSTEITGDDESFVYYKASGVGVHYLMIGRAQDGATVPDVSAPVEEVETTEETKEETKTEEPASAIADPTADITADVTPVNLDSPNPIPQPQLVAQPEPEAQPAQPTEKEGGAMLNIFILMALVILIVVLYLIFGKGRGRSSVDKELHNYIRESMKRGKSKDDVRNRLLEVGWHSDRVEKALAKYKDKSHHEAHPAHETLAPLKAEHHAVSHYVVTRAEPENKPAKKKPVKKKPAKRKVSKKAKKKK